MVLLPHGSRAAIIAADRRVASAHHTEGDPTSMTRRRSTILAGVACLAVVLAACGGATSSDSTPTSAASQPAASAAPSEAAPSVALPSVDASAIVLPSFDPSEILANLEGVDSYRISMSTDGEVGYQAVVVTKPVLSRDIRLGPDPDDDRIVVIGDEAWMDSGDGFEPLPAALASSMLLAFDPMILAGGFANTGAWAGSTDLGTEEHNGVDTRHIRIDGSTLGAMVPNLPAGASIDAWVATDGGYIVGLEVVGEGGKGFVIDVTGVNDPANVVERPV
jgi:hypothetical protein